MAIKCISASLSVSLTMMACLPSFASEVDRKADIVVQHILRKCDSENYLFINSADVLFNYRGVSINLHPENLTDADKLNDLQWNGEVHVSVHLLRARPDTHSPWGRWENGSEDEVKFLMWEEHGKWHVFLNVRNPDVAVDDLEKIVVDPAAMPTCDLL